MTIKQRYEIFFWAGFILWILETAFFGWNANAQSGAERVLDIVSIGLMLIGTVGTTNIIVNEYYKNKTKER